MNYRKRMNIWSLDTIFFSLKDYELVILKISFNRTTCIRVEFIHWMSIYFYIKLKKTDEEHFSFDIGIDYICIWKPLNIDFQPCTAVLPVNNWGNSCSCDVTSFSTVNPFQKHQKYFESVSNWFITEFGEDQSSDKC